MTVWEILGLCRHYWLVTLLGLALTTGTVVFVANQDGTYAGQVNVILLEPPSMRGNALISTTNSLISLAGVISRVTGGSGGDASPASDSVTLVGEGVRRGYSIQQPNSGNQFNYIFDKPILDVQSAGSTLAEARANMDTALAKIRGALDELQDDAGVSADMRIGIQLSPTEPVFIYEHGSRIRAVGVATIVGVIMTLGAAFSTGRILDRRRGRLADLRIAKNT